MSTQIGSDTRGALRVWLGVFGLLAVVAGVVILVWPGKSATAFMGAGAVIFAIYAIVGGIVYFGSGIFSSGMGGWSRLGRLVLGALLVVAGIIALANIGATAMFFALFMTISIGVAWILEGIFAFMYLGQSDSKGWTVFFAIVSILAGGLILFSPLYGFAALWWVFGISAIVYGVLQMIAAFSIKS